MKKAIYIALFTAFIWVLGIFTIPIPGIPVPMVLQNLGVLLSGAVLGPFGTISVIMLLLLATLGIPVLPGGRGGISIFFGPTAGYLYGYILAAFVVGWLTKRYWGSLNIATAIVINLIGILVIYMIGIPILMYNANLELFIAIKSNLIFIPFDIFKAILSATLSLLFKKYYPLMLQSFEQVDDTRK